MITYKNFTYDSTEALYKALKADFDTLVFPFSVMHKTFGAGQLVYVTVPTSGSDSLYVTIDFETVSKIFSLKALFELKALDMPENLKSILVDAQSAFYTDYEFRQQEKRQAKRLADEKAKQEAEDKKQEAKYQVAKAKAIKEFENLTAREATPSTESEFYNCLGWIANNCGAFACTIPDYLLSDFQKQFGVEYEPRVVDSRKRTGNMQGTISMTANIKKKALSNIPAFLTQYLSKSGNAIADVAFICDLVSNYGFKFGKVQDTDQIKATISANYLTYFETGYAE